MVTYVVAQSKRLDNCEKLKNPASFFDTLVNGLKQEEGRRRKKEEVRSKKKEAKCHHNKDDDDESQIAPTSPIHIFCKRQRPHPEYPLLMKAVMDKDRPLANEIMSHMARDGWRSYLSAVRPSDTSAFFLYPARTEGRKPRRTSYPCRAPLLDAQGRRHFAGQAKCNVLADFFAERLRGTEQHGASLTKAEASRRESAQWRRLQQTDEFAPFLEAEVKKAIAVMAKKKATGADGLAAELFHYMPCLLQPTVRLFNIILQTGRMPHQLLRVIMIPLVKPRKGP